MESKSETKHLCIEMGYVFVGDTGIDVPVKLLEGKTEEEKLKIGFEYAMEHIDKIPVACNAAYVENSDNCELEDVHWED